MKNLSKATHLIYAASDHVRSTGHTVEVCDDPVARRLGFVCTSSECDEGWQVSMVQIRMSMSSQGDSLIPLFGTLQGRMRLALEINKQSGKLPRALTVRHYILRALKSVKNRQVLQEWWVSDGNEK